VLILILFCLCATALAGQAGIATGTSTATSIDSLPASLLSPESHLAALGGATEPLPLPSLIEASLIASGVAPGDLAFRTAALSSLIDGIAAHIDRGASNRARAEAALELLHEGGTLRAYSENATSIVDILDRGRFNCVSSALLYLLVVKRLGIECHGVETRDHAFCLVRADGRDIDVETTNPSGFDPGTRKDFTDSFGRTTGYSYVPPGSYNSREIIGERALLSLVLSNRSAILEEGRHYAEALALAASFSALRGDARGRTFLLDRINNLVNDYASRRQWEAARLLLSAAGSEPRLTTLRRQITDSALAEAVAKKPFHEALALVDEAARAGNLEAARAREYRVYLYGNEANRIGRSGDWLAAAALAEEGARATQGEAALAGAVATFRRNYVVDVHNRFAVLYNARRYTEARRVVEEGLARMPGDSRLVEDLKAASAAGG
jgi:hypothetical protein